MEWLWLIVVGLLVYFFLRSGKNRSTFSGDAGRVRILSDNEDWLRVRWANAERERAAGTLMTIPAWFFDPVTERQLERIQRDGLSVSGVGLTKGKASDLIGLFEPVEEEHEAILKFFKIHLGGMNQSRGRHEVGKLLADAKNAAAWNLRPAEPLQKEYLRFFNVKVPKGLTCVGANRLISENRGKLEDEDSPKLDEWDLFESIATDLADKETRDDYDLKKPSLSVLRAAIDALRKDGNSMDDLAGDLDMVAQKLIELKPELAKQR